jgi:hypothetical protein
MDSCSLAAGARRTAMERSATKPVKGCR